jgi:hypothetical protein
MNLDISTVVFWGISPIEIAENTAFFKEHARNSKGGSTLHNIKGSGENIWVQSGLFRAAH